MLTLLSAGLLVALFAIVVALNVLSLWMKTRANEKLSEKNRLSLWSTDTQGVERIYGEQHPDSVLPELFRYGRYLGYSLGTAAILAVLILKNTSR